VGPRAGAASPVRVGFVGAGSVLWAYLQLLDRLVPRGLAEIGPVCARRRERWPRILERRPGLRLVEGPEAVVEDEVDVVAVLTPADAHGEHARLALERGRHVLVEKPLARSPAEGLELAALARERGLHLVAAPFVHLSPTFRALWAEIDGGAIGRVHSARALYGVTRPDWNDWMVEVGPLADLGIYNLKSFTSLLGPVVEVVAAEASTRRAEAPPGDAADVIHVTVRHEGGALSSTVASWEIPAYHRAALELYGTAGAATLLGDDWDPRGYEVYLSADRTWRSVEALDPTWLWTDGLRDLIAALREGRPPLANLDQDVHLLEVLEAARVAAAERAAVPVTSRFEPLDLRLPVREPVGHVHDRTRPPDEQR
jgi:predicted dehydrogenase